MLSDPKMDAVITAMTDDLFGDWLAEGSPATLDRLRTFRENAKRNGGWMLTVLASQGVLNQEELEKLYPEAREKQGEQ